MEKVTAGKDSLGEFAPEFARLNDDVLFGEVWSREDKLTPKIRSIITISSLITSGIFDNSLTFHMAKAKDNGVTKTEIAEILTQLAFYSGWPKAWAAFNMAKNVWTENNELTTNIDEFSAQSVFPIGNPNEEYAQFFVGKSYIHMLTNEGVKIANVTFEPACRNNWHIHKAQKGGGQILLCTSGEGWYQEWGMPAQKLTQGDAVIIPEGVKHWHGAAAYSWFSHLAIEVPGDNANTEWLEAVDEVVYGKL